MPSSVLWRTEGLSVITHRIVPASFFLLLALFHLKQLVAFIESESQGALTPLAFSMGLAHRIAGVIFLMLIAVFMAIRHVPLRKSDGLRPRLVALGGTFLMGIVAFLPQESRSAGFSLGAAVLLVSGTVIATAAVAALGRSFSIMPEARRLITAWPYSVIRHPIYFGEILSSAGLVLGNRSLGALAVYLIFVWLQIQRTKYEEAVLDSVFPDYEEYRRHTARLIPLIY